ncbi:hypothetical protein FVR03_09040 [Pontibacter qinzhouensis]|uniref:TonB C-terminal domain-containing protein n=1 Tax=Pontibacter qinzhouensis TaxID=2603253 RepID=A0A5C8K977_9BACT|nr:hypothetical protein [Pontibacter qinzhouensis]TXK47680.1 hypothetical protein FVR03_09040 [Pontibacter qinzhouensis]
MDIAIIHEEEKNKKIAAVVSVILHALIILLLFYLMAWRPQDPPAKDNGIEINFGLSAVGSGNVQTTATPNESKNVQDSKPAPTQPDPQPEPKPVAANPPAPTRPVETPKVVTTTADAPVAVKEVKEVAKPTPKPEPKVEPKKEPEKPVEEPKKEPEKPKSLYPGKPTESTGTGKAGTSNEATGNNNGDDINKVGDKGSPDGKLDAKALYGKAGGGAGGLDMAGWRYEIEPKRDPYPNESGIVKFRISINGNGEVINISLIESNVSPQVRKWYEDQLRKTSFIRTGGGNTNAGATGTVTFVIKSN